jgi:hypothetical protein
MNGHRKEAVENSPASEEFTIVGVGSFRGSWDRSAVDESEDKGRVKEKNIHARIMVNSVPSGLTERTSKITREGETTPEYIFSFYDVDDEGQGLIWLY